MKRKVSFIVDPVEFFPKFNGDITLASAMSNMKERLESIGESMPTVRYRVTYTIAPKHGRLTIPENKGVTPFETSPTGYWNGVIVCQLPKEWAGLRFNRKVVLL